MGHNERAHALLSASSAHRWLACTPSARLEEGFPDTASEAAREGTLAHELAEAKVRNYFYTADFGKRKLNNFVKKLKGDGLWQDEMMGYTDDYLDYIKSAALAYENVPFVAIEKRVDLGDWIPEGFGTADCILIGGGVLQVVDFKYGKGVAVRAEENPQMKLYALGAYKACGMLYPVKSIKMSIVQPRIQDGVSEWGCSPEHLLAFGEHVKQRAALAFKGEGEFTPGDAQCRFCRARAKCRARAEENMRLAFAIDKKPPLLSNGEVGQYLKQGRDVARWLADLKDYALAECLAGRSIPGWKAVEGRSVRAWSDMDKAFDVLIKSGIAPEEMLWEKKPLSLAQVEKLVGKKDFTDAVGSFVAKTPGKPALVEESDKRAAVTNTVSAADAFREG